MARTPQLTGVVTELHRAALWYARRGYFVFPIHSIRNGKCDCNDRPCLSPGKHPRIRGGFTNATTDAELINHWWGMWPEAYVGIAAGMSGLAVIDVDIDKGGDESLRDLEERFERLPDTVRSITGGGGAHIVFKKPQSGFSSRVSIAPGLDTRGDGGYIVAAPSGHESGGSYVWEADHKFGDIPLAEVPLWFMELMQQATRQDNGGVPTADILAGVAKGDRDLQLFRLAAKMRQCDIPIADAYFLVERAAANCTPPFGAAAARKKVDSAYRYAPGQTAIVAADSPHGDGLSGRIDLWPYMSGGVPEPDWVITGALLRGMVTLLHGEPGCGKTILALYFARELVRTGATVMFVDEESGTQLVAERLWLMGLTEEEVSRIHYYPFAGITLADAQALVDEVEEVSPALVIFDSMADVLAASGLDENAAGDVTKWMVGIAARLGRKTKAQPAVLILDHNTKSTDTVQYARGSGAKKSKSDVAFFVNKTVDFDNETLGRVRLERTKNRPGVIPENLTFVVGGTGHELLVEPFDISQHEITVATVHEQRAIDALAGGPPEGLANAQLQGVLGLGHSRVVAVMAALEKQGSVARNGFGRGTKYVLINRPVDAKNRPVDEASTTDLRPPSEALPQRGRPASGRKAGEVDESTETEGQRDNDF